MLDEDLRPIPKTDVDYKSLPINPTPEEYFLLSRINGNQTVAEICSISGLSEPDTHRALERLAEAGLIEIPEPEPDVPPAADESPSGIYNASHNDQFEQEEAPSVEQPIMADAVAPDSEPALSDAATSQQGPVTSEPPTSEPEVAAAADEALAPPPPEPESVGGAESSSAVVADPAPSGAQTASSLNTSSLNTSSSSAPPAAASSHTEASTPTSEPAAQKKQEEPPKKKSKKLAPVVDLAHFEMWSADFQGYVFDEEAMQESVDLNEEERRHILFFHGHLDALDYYQILGVPRDAARKELRGAYFKLSKRFHPDSFYNKETGSFGTRIEDIFHALNRAHQTLSRKKKRAEYDATLGDASSAPSAQPVAPPQARQQQQSSARSSTPAQDRAKGVDPKKREMAFNLLVKRAEKHEAAGDYADAAGEYRKAFSIKHDPNVALRGANLLMRCGEEHLEDAILLAKAAAKEEPENSKPLILIGDAYEEKGDYDAAKTYYNKAKALEPDNKIVQRRLKYVESASR